MRKAGGVLRQFAAGFPSAISSESLNSERITQTSAAKSRAAEGEPSHCPLFAEGLERAAQQIFRRILTADGGSRAAQGRCSQSSAAHGLPFRTAPRDGGIIRSTMHHSALFRGPEAPECLALCIRTKFFPPKVDFAGKSQVRRIPRTICPYRILYQFGLFFNRPETGQLKKNAENCEINAAIGAQPVFKTHSTRAYT